MTVGIDGLPPPGILFEGPLSCGPFLRIPALAALGARAARALAGLAAVAGRLVLPLLGRRLEIPHLRVVEPDPPSQLRHRVQRNHGSSFLLPGRCVDTLNI